MICGEHYPNILAGAENKLFCEIYCEIYRRTVSYLLERAKPESRPDVVPPGQGDSTLVELSRPVRVDTVRYELPVSIDFNKHDWHRTAAPYPTM
jgi:hypothetical protein